MDLIATFHLFRNLVFHTVITEAAMRNGVNDQGSASDLSSPDAEGRPDDGCCFDTGGCSDMGGCLGTGVS